MKIKVSSIYAYLISIWGFIYIFANLTTFYVSTGISLSRLYRYYSLVVFAFMYSKMAFDFFKNVPKYKIRLIILLVLLIISCLNTNSDFLYPAMIFLLASKNINIKHVLKKILDFQILAVFITITLYLVKILNDVTVYRAFGQARSSLGFEHPNTLGNILLQICLITFYVYSKNNRVRTYLTCVFSLLICFFVANSRTAAYIILIILICEFIESLFNNIRSNKIIRLIKSLFTNNSSVIFIALIVLSVLSASGIIRIGISDQTFQARFILMRNYFNAYKLNLFGRNLYIGNSDQSMMAYYDQARWDLRTLDNSYIYLLLGFGVVITVCFFVLFILRLKMAAKAKDYILIIVFLMYAIDGFLETTLIRTCFNYFILTFTDVIWNKKLKN